MVTHVSKFVYWAPRILSILFIMFLTVFSFDVFTPGAAAGEIALAFFVHNIPSLVLLAVLIISWKYEIVGGIAYLLAGIGYIVINAQNRGDWAEVLTNILIIAGPAFIISALYFVNWSKKKRIKLQQK